MKIFKGQNYKNFRHPDFVQVDEDGDLSIKGDINAFDESMPAEDVFLKMAMAGLLENKSYRDPRELLASLVGYFKWISSFPLQESKASVYQGIVEFYNLPRKRCPTLGGMCLFLGIETMEWVKLRDGEVVEPEHQEAFNKICVWAEEEIVRQKFENAAAGLLNPMIIARDLGLSEKSEITGKDGEPLHQPLTIDPSKLSPEVMEAILAAQNKDGNAPTQ